MAKGRSESPSEDSPQTLDPKVGEIEQEKQAKASRENQQIILYIFISSIIASAWMIGYLEFSFLWTFILIVFTFLVWWGKVISLTEEHIKYHETLLHRKRALRHCETTEWLNFIINRWWVFSSSSIQNLIQKNLNPLLTRVRPSFIETIGVESFSLGDTTPFIKYMKVYECSEWRAGSRKALSWLSVGQPPPGLAQTQQYQLVLEADVALHCDEFKMVFRTRLGGKWMGMNLDVAVEKLNISGKLQLVLHLNMDTAFPHISTVTLSFQEKPEVWFAIRMLKAVQMMEIPLLKSWIHSLVMDGLTEALVDPGKIDICTESSGPTYAPARSKAKSNAQGLLTVTVSSEHNKGSVFTEDLRYCVLRLADTDQKQTIGQTQGPGAWQDSCSFLIENITKDKVIIKSKSKRLLSTYTLAQFDLTLADFPLQQKPVVEVTVEEKVSKWAAGGSVKLDLELEYTPLPSIEDEVHHETEKPGVHLQGQGVAGVMHVSVHGAHNLLALDRTGTSDPYCIIFSNGKKMKTTHYVCRTRNPTWDVHTEFIVGDFTKTMLSFLVYDWDGRHASEDDFLGSAYMVLSQDEPRAIRRSLTLGYNLVNVGQVDNMKLGSICVSAIFRPVTSVAKSGTLHTPEMSNVTQDVSFQEHQAIRNRNFMASAKLKFTGTKDPKGVGDLLSMGHGILELNILRARELVPMDSNGFSDPFCEVRIGTERKFTTSIKKKTLNPVWDEWVTMQLPKPNETLELIMWDRDPFFKKDFLGLVSFSLEELKKNSAEPTNAHWFPLQRIRSGSIQLHFKVITEDAGHGEYETLSPAVSASDSTDSGLVHSMSGSPVADQGRPLTPRHAAPWCSTVTSQSHMSPILETPRAGPDLTRHCEQPTTDTLLITQTEREEVLLTSESPLSSMSPTSTTSPTSPTSPSEGSPTMATLEPPKHLPPVERATSPPPPPPPPPRDPPRGRRRSSLGGRLRRAVSDVNIKSHAQLTPIFKTVSQGASPSNTRGQLCRMDSVSSWGDGADGQQDFTWSPDDKYHQVAGRVLRVRGLPNSTKPVYVKVRLDTRNVSARFQKHCSSRVLNRSASIDVTEDDETEVDLQFEVDRGRGVRKDALLIFDIKTSTRDHLATKGFTLVHLLADSPSVQRWICLGDTGVELKVQLSVGVTTPGIPKKSSSGFFQLMRASTRRKKTQ